MTEAQKELLAAAKALTSWLDRVLVPTYTDRRPIPENFETALKATRSAIVAVEWENEKPVEVCEWTENDPYGPMPGTFDGTCGVCWYLDLSLAPPDEQDVTFCPRCGKPVAFSRWVPEPDEDDEESERDPAGSNGGVR